MPTEIKQKEGTAIGFGVSASFAPADPATQYVASISYALTMASLANAAGRQSAKADLGATRAAEYACMAAFDYTGETPTATNTVDVYWLPSTSGTTANGNIAGNSGNDGAAPDGAVPGGLTLNEFIRMGAIPIGSLYLSDDASVQSGFVGTFRPPTRYGQILVVNNGGDVLESDDVENHVALIPIIDEIQ